MPSELKQFKNDIIKHFDDKTSEIKKEPIDFEKLYQKTATISREEFAFLESRVAALESKTNKK